MIRDRMGDLASLGCRKSGHLLVRIFAKRPCANLLAQVHVECWLFWGTMMPVQIRTGSPNFYRGRALRCYGTVPFRLRKMATAFGSLDSMMCSKGNLIWS